MKPSEIKPGWYKACLDTLPRNAIRVHSVCDGFVFFTRRGLPHMSKTPLRSFIGMVISTSNTKRS